MMKKPGLKIRRSAEAPSTETPCPHCGDRLISARPEPPTRRQIAFGLSFIAFMIFADRVYDTWGNAGLAGWFVVQAGLGIALAHGRLAAKRRVYRCTGCGATVR